MSKSCLLASDAIEAIHDENESRFVVLGEIQREYIPELQIESGRMIDPGTWEFEIKGDILKALEYRRHGLKVVFRVVGENRATISSEGFLEKGPDFLRDGIYEAKIKASGERVQRN